MSLKKLCVALLVVLDHGLVAQEFRWQQRVEYTMNVHLDVSNHKLTGDQHLVYYNNSSDTLKKVYYHLYFNAFQPGSMMDVRSRTIKDPDKRIDNRIESLKANEIGYQKIINLFQDGIETQWVIRGTILEVTLAKPILPRSKTIFEMKFEAQVPLQIRRSGRNNKEGIAYSMTQWYPKMAEYDFQGWHAYPYVQREFHGVWGDFDVSITLDSKFIIASTGELQNPEKIGYGYEPSGVKVKRTSPQLTWRFVAANVHDFAWTADPDYTHTIVKVPGGPNVHFFYQKSSKTAAWEALPKIAVPLFQFLNEKFGKYPYSTYSVIQGGDGGMEYPMCTLILGEGTFDGVAGTMIHEIGHSWFQGVLASNEALYPWMDEGFTRFAEYEAIGALLEIPNPHMETYQAYTELALSGKEEPASQHADYFTLNHAYKIASYFKGCIMLHQLRYIIGEENFWKGMHSYFYTWKFRHPEPIDFIRTMENASGMQLKWYLNYWIHTTKRIDYGIGQVKEQGDVTVVTLARKGELPMPIDLLVTYKDGSKELYYIPLNETLGSKPIEDKNIRRINLEAWNWVNPDYMVTLNRKASEIASIQIDPSRRLADINLKDNLLDRIVSK